MFRARPISVTFGLLLASLAAHAQQDTALWRYTHPNAKALIGIDWRKLSASHAGTILREKWINTNGAAVPGIEFLDDVDRVLISSPGREGGDESAEAPILIVARGRFDLAKVRHALTAHGARAQMFNNIAVYRPQGKSGKDMAFVVLDAQTILIGDARSVFQSLDLNRSPEAQAPSSPISARAAELEANYEAWAIIQGTGGIGGAEPQTFEAGISVRNGLAADIHLILPNEPVARSMASDLSELFKTMAKDKATDPSMVDITKKLKVTSEGSTAKISLRLTPQEVERNARMFAASHKTSAPAGAVAAAPVIPAIRPVVTPPPAATPARPERGTIKIEGLDEGTREIPYKRPDQ
jgi:hypothetical protein